MSDLKGTSHMTQGSATKFTTDRFGNANSALALNGGWTQVPSGIYFDTPEFTISVWVLPQDVEPSSSILDFGNGAGIDNVLFGFSLSDTQKPYVCLFPTNFASDTVKLKIGEWQFLVASFDGNNLKIYMNGQIIMDIATKYTFPLVTRNNCYIGRNNWNDGPSKSFLDDLRFYNKALTQSEISQLMNYQGKK